ncbi:MAG: hypothetical protein ACOYN6_14205 [Ignavibacteria bacterium]
MNLKTFAKSLFEGNRITLVEISFAEQRTFPAKKRFAYLLRE